MSDRVSIAGPMILALALFLIAGCARRQTPVGWIEHWNCDQPANVFTAHECATREKETEAVAR